LAPTRPPNTSDTSRRRSRSGRTWHIRVWSRHHSEVTVTAAALEAFWCPFAAAAARRDPVPLLPPPPAAAASDAATTTAAAARAAACEAARPPGFTDASSLHLQCDASAAEDAGGGGVPPASAVGETTPPPPPPAPLRSTRSIHGASDDDGRAPGHAGGEPGRPVAWGWWCAAARDAQAAVDAAIAPALATAVADGEAPWLDEARS